MSVAVRALLAQQHDQFLRELVDFVQIPSISTIPEYAEHIAAGAKFVARRMQQAGLEHVRQIESDGHPLVYGDWLHAGDAPTLLIYGHYDVQPPDPLEAWLSPPFAPEVRDGRLYGRGVSDDKGPMLIPLRVAQAFQACEGGLPVNIKMLIEGEEEVGSRHLGPTVRQYRELLRADLALSADGAQWRADLPSVNVGSRGVITMEITLTTAAKDLHSGRYGGTVANATHLLARLVAGLHDPDGRIAVAGFYDGVAELDAATRVAIAEIPFDEAQYLAGVGASAPVGEAGYSTLERQWVRPTLDVCGIWGGYNGPGSKTVIPCAAHAKLSCRLVPGQNPEHIRALLAAHLEAHCPTGGHIAIRDDGMGMAAASVRADHPGLQTAEAVLQELHGIKPLQVRMGSSIPIGAIFAEFLGVETVYFSFSTSDEDFHAPNEFIRLESLWTGLQAWALYWEALRGKQAAYFS